MDREWLEELLGKTDIVKLISRYVPLKRKGRTYWGCCPFHHEKDPSFAVNEEKQFFHCFGCKEGGNAISFVQKMESLDFIDAVRMLADEAKMELPPFIHYEGPDRKKRERLYALNREAARRYHVNLHRPEGKLAREYLERREIPMSLATRFGLGMSIDRKDVIRHLVSEGFTPAEIVEAGIARQRADEYYDFFNGRLMIPIINNFGEVVGFGGRVLDPGSHVQGKYFNSPATPIFDKSRTLYAINLLKKKKQRERINYVIIVEGYMDVITLHKAGFDTALAGMGTAFTPWQAKLIRNYTDNVYVCYDGDSAGQMATLRGLDVLRAAGLNVKVVSLPDELDPDDFIRQRGKEAYQKALDDAMVLPEFKLKNLMKKYDLASPDGKAAYAIEAMKVIKALENPVEQEEYLKVVNGATGYPIDVLRKQADLVRLPEERQYYPPPEPSAPKKGEERSAAELFTVASLVHARDYVKADDDVYPYLENDLDRRLCEYALAKIRAGERPSVSAMYTEFDGEDFSPIADYEFLDGDGREKYEACLSRLKAAYYARERKILAAKYDETKDADILGEIVALDKKIRESKNGGYNV